MTGLEHLGNAPFCIAAFVGRPGEQLHRDRLARHALGLDVAGHGVPVAGIDAGGHSQIGYCNVGRPPVGADPDGEDGYFCFRSHIHRGLRRDARVLAAVAHDDNARDGRAPFRLN